MKCCPEFLLIRFGETCANGWHGGRSFSTQSSLETGGSATQDSTRGRQEAESEKMLAKGFIVVSMEGLEAGKQPRIG